MNRIDALAKLLQIEDQKPRKIVKYTRSEMLVGKDISYLDCFNDDTYVEIFYERFTLILGGYMKISDCEDWRLNDDASELLSVANMKEFNESELKKTLENFVNE